MALGPVTTGARLRGPTYNSLYTTHITPPRDDLPFSDADDVLHAKLFPSSMRQLLVPGVMVGDHACTLLRGSSYSMVQLRSAQPLWDMLGMEWDVFY